MQGALWLAKRYRSILISFILAGRRYFLNQVPTQLSRISQESNPAHRVVTAAS